MNNEQEIFRYEAILSCDDRSGSYHYVEFPWPVEELFGTRSSVRVIGKLNNMAVDRALMPRGDGTHFIIVSRDMCRRGKFTLGDTIQVELRRNQNPNDIELPEELQAALDLEPLAQQRYNNLNPGMKRNIVYWIDSAKRPETRANRAVEMMNRLLANYFHKNGKKISKDEPADQ